MQFKVPQYIEVESKLVGKFSFRQLVYLGGSAGLSYVVFRFLHWFSVPFIIGIVVFTYYLTFSPKEKFGRPFVAVVESAIKYALKGKLYIWKRNPPQKAKKKVETQEVPEKTTLEKKSAPRPGKSSLSDVSMNLTVGGGEETDQQEKTTGRENAGPITSNESIGINTSVSTPAQ